MFAKKNVGMIAAALAAVAMSSAALAGSADANLAVSASIASECIISSGTPVDFGVYSPIVANLTAAIDQTGTVSVTCTTGSTPATVALDQGLWADTASTAAVPVRRMKDPVSGAFLSYGLYKEVGRTTNWGSAGRAVATPDGTAHAETVYGRLPGAQNKPVGSYSDTVVATVSF